MFDLRGQNVIDSRDVVERIDELESERNSLDERIHAAESTEESANIEEEKAEWEAENADELEALKNLAKEGEEIASDWSYGETLIREDYFEEGVQQFVEDIGDLPGNLPSYIAINWAETAENLRYDYSTVDFDGETYLIRSC